jgi:hypothetical protein
MVMPLAMLHAPPKLEWPPERMANWQLLFVMVVMAVETSSTVVGETMHSGWRLEFCCEKYESMHDL